MSRFIQDPSQPFPVQAGLFGTPGIGSYRRDPFPPITRSMVEIIDRIRQEPDRLGFDAEFDPPTLRPTVIGVAGRDWAGGMPWNDNVALELLQAAHRGVKLVTYSGLGERTDKAVLEHRLGTKTPLNLWTDAMIKHYLANQDFAKSDDKEEDSGESGSIGLYNLWAFASFYLDLPQWKWCRGLSCEGPCPKHRVFEYCAVDAWAGVAGDYAVDDDLACKRIPSTLYTHVAELTDLCGRIQSKGVTIDRELVRQLETDNETRKTLLFPFEQHGKKKVFTGPFNPNSSEQIIDYFSNQKIKLKTTDKKEVLKALRLESKRRGWTIDDLDNQSEEDLGDGLANLFKLHQYKSAGKSFDAWVADRYFGNDGRVHPRFNATGTSTGRLASSSPNFQNLPRVTGAAFRRCVVPANPDLTIVKADYSQLEFRVCLWYAGVEPPAGDIFKWLVAQRPDDFEEALRLIGNPKWTTRDIAKSVSHAADYAEGFMALSPSELATERRVSEQRYGALLVFRDWEYRGKVVCFTGANLAERFFGDKSFESRKKALQIQEVYFNALPAIRRWHRALSLEIEERNAVQSASGRYLELYGTPEDDFKMAAAFKGQGGGADLCQEKMLLNDKQGGYVPTLQVHDELVMELPRVWSDRECVDYMSFMATESKIFPGLSCPVKVSRGPNWGSCKEIIP